MSQQIVNVGVQGNDGTGDSIRDSFTKVNNNFTELYAVFGEGGQITFNNLADAPGTESFSITNIAPSTPSAGSVSISFSNPNILLSPFTTGQNIIINGCTPSGYNGNYLVTAASSTTVTVTNSTVGTTTSLGQVTGKPYSANQIIMGNTTGSGLSARTLIAGTNIHINTDNNSSLSISASAGLIVDDPGPTLGNFLNAAGLTIGRLSDPSELLVSEFNAYYGSLNPSLTTTLNQLPVTVGYANTNFLKAVNGQVVGALRVRDEPSLPQTSDVDYDATLQGNYVATEAIQRRHAVRRDGDTMTGALTLSDHPAPLNGKGIVNSSSDLQAATKYYVDNNTYYSGVNLYVSATKGDDLQRNTPSGRNGRAWQYAFKTVGAAALYADSLINLSSIEPGPYRQTIAYTISPTQYKSTVQSVTIVGGNSAIQGYIDATALLEANRAFIQAETIAYINKKYVNQFSFDQTRWAGIIDDILNAVGYDLVFSNGNSSPLSNYNTVTQTSLLLNNNNADIISNYFLQLTDAINYAYNQLLSYSYNVTNTQNYITSIIDAIAADIVFQTNYVSIQTALAFSYANTGLTTTEIVGALTNLSSVIISSASWNTSISTSTTIQSFISNKITTIIDIISSGTVPSPVFPAISTTTSGQLSAQNLLLNNIPFIQAELTAYLTANYPSLSYNVALSQRDTQYIVWSLVYDLMYGGNSQSVYAGERYRYNATLHLSAGEQVACADAVNYLNTLAQNIITNTLLGSGSTLLYQNSVVQYTNATYLNGDSGLINGTVTTIAASIAANITTIVNVINGSHTSPSVTAPSYSNGASLYQTVRTTLESQKSGDTFTGTITNTSLIISGSITGSVSFGAGDIISGVGVSDGTKIVSGGGTTWTVNNSQTVGPVTMTTGLVQGATNYINATYSIINDPTTNSIITDLFSGINLLLQNGLTSRAAPTFVNPTGLLSANSEAQTALIDNILFIQEEITSWIAVNYPLTTIDIEATERAVGYLIEALAYDLTYGGNGASSAVAQTFIKSANAVGDGLGSLYVVALTHATTVVNTVLSNSPVTATLGNYLSVTSITVSTPSVGYVQLGFATQTSNPFTIGQSITVRGLTPSLFNSAIGNSYTVTGVGTNYVQFANSNTDTTGFVSGAGTITTQVQYAGWSSASAVTTGTQPTNYQTTTTLLNEIITIIGATTVTTSTSTGVTTISTVTTSGSGSVTVNYTLSYPVITNTLYNQIYITTQSIITNNYSSLGIDTTSYLAETYTGGFNYNQTICYRDVGLILDAMVIDMRVNGTYQSINAGRSYYSNASAQGIAIGTQYKETIDGLVFAFGDGSGSNIGLVYQVLNQTTSPTRYQTLVSQQTNSTLSTSYAPTLAAINTYTSQFYITYNIITNGLGAAPAITTSTFGTGYYQITFSNGGNGYVDQGIPGDVHIIPGKILVGDTSNAHGQIISYTTGTQNGGTNYDIINMYLTQPGFFQYGEYLDYGETVSNLNITIFLESGIYYEDYPIKLPANVTISGDDFRRTIIRPLNRISQSPWRSTFFYRDGVIDALQIGPINYSGTDYAASIATSVTISGTSGNFTATLSGGAQAVATWGGLVFTEAVYQVTSATINTGTNTATITFIPIEGNVMPASPYVQGQNINIEGMTPTSYNGVYPISTISVTGGGTIGGIATITVLNYSTTINASAYGNIVAGKAVVNTVSGNVLNCTTIYPFTAAQTYTANNWHLFSTINFGRHYLSNPLDINSTPLNNQNIDVFLCNDATRIKLLTMQGHGGFAMVLDPTGQIKTKSPYGQESAVFSASINTQAFRGGQFVDGFAGRLFGNIIGIASANGVAGLSITIQGTVNSGLDVRPPQTPCAFYLQGFRYQVNNVTSYNASATVTTAAYTGGGALGANTVVIATNLLVLPGQVINGNNIPTGTYIKSINSNTLTLSANFTGQASGTYTFLAPQVTITIDVSTPFNPATIYSSSAFANNLGNIIDAIAYDNVLGSNYQTVKQGLIYLAPQNAVATTAELFVTQGISYAKLLINTLSLQSSTKTNASAYISTINNIIQNGTVSVPTLVYTDPSGVTTTTSQARKNITLNKSFIQAEISAWISSNYIITTLTNYTAVKSQRDTGYIVDAISYDLLYGGNSSIYDIALTYYSSFFNGTSELGTNQEVCLASFVRLGTVLQQIVQNQTVTASSGNLLSQNYTTYTAATETLSSVVIGSSGTFTCATAPRTLTVGQSITISGTNTGSGSVTNGTYYIVATNGTTSFSLSSYSGGSTISTTAGTPSGLSFTFSVEAQTIATLISVLIDYVADGNFNNAVVGTLVSGSTTVSNLSYSPYLTNGISVSGTGIPSSTTISNINWATGTATLSQAATATSPSIAGSNLDGTTITFASAVTRTTPTISAQTTSAITDFYTLTNNKIASLTASFASGGANGTSSFVVSNTGNVTITNGITNVVSTTGLNGTFSCTSSNLVVGNIITITGVNTGTGTISGYASGNVYYIIAQSGGTAFTLSTTLNGTAITTTIGTLTGLTFVESGSVAGILPGMTVTGTGVPSGTAVGNTYVPSSAVIPLVSATTGLSVNLTQQAQGTYTFGSGSIDIEDTTVNYVNAGANTGINIEMGGNKSMLSNDFTMVNDLGYGLLVTNGGAAEAVSMFTYYNYVSYWALNGGQIRSVAGSSAYGVYGLRATGSDVTELPNAVNLSNDMVQVARIYKEGIYSSSQTTATNLNLTVYIINYEYAPEPTSELEIDHTASGGVITRYLINTVTHTSVYVSGQNVLALALSTSGTNSTTTTGLAYPLYDGQLVTIRVLQSIKFYNITNVKPVRPSTALQYSANLGTIYRIIAYNLTESTGEQLPANTSVLQTDSSFNYITFTHDTSNVQNADLVNYTAKAFVAINGSGNNTSSTTLTVNQVTGTILAGQILGGIGFTNQTVSTVNTNTAVTTGSTISSSGVFTVGTLGSGTVSVGMVLTGTNVVGTVYIIANISGSGGGSTWQTNTTTSAASGPITGTSYTITLSAVPTIIPVGPVIFSTQSQGSKLGDSKIAVLSSSVSTTINLINQGTYLVGWGGKVFRVISYTQSNTPASGLFNQALSTTASVTGIIGNGLSSASAGQIFTPTGIASQTGTFTVGMGLTGSGITNSTYITAINSATFTSTISSTTLTATWASGTIAVGMVLTGGGVTAGTYIVALVSGSGSSGTSTWTLNQSATGTPTAATSYTVNISQLVTSNTFTGYSTTIYLTATSGTFVTNALVTGTGFNGTQYVVSFTQPTSTTAQIVLNIAPNTVPSGTITIGASTNAFLTIDPNSVYNLSSVGTGINSMTFASQTLQPNSTTARFVTFNIPYSANAVLPPVDSFVTVANQANTNYNGTYQVVGINNKTQITTTSTTTLVTGMSVSSINTTITITAITASTPGAGYFTVSYGTQTSAPFGVGSTVIIAGVTTTTGYNGTYTVYSLVSGTGLTGIVVASSQSGAATVTGATISNPYSYVPSGAIIQSIDSSTQFTISPAAWIPYGAAVFSQLYGTVASVTITNGGSGYTNAPTLVFSGGGVLNANQQAIAVCTITGGSITAVTVVSPGFGYTSVPTITLSNVSGGAILTAVITVPTAVSVSASAGVNTVQAQLLYSTDPGTSGSATSVSTTTATLSTSSINSSGVLTVGSSAGTITQNMILTGAGVAQESSVTAATVSTNTGTVTFTVVTTLTNPYAVGQLITVSGMIPSGYNGTYPVTASSTTTFSSTAGFISGNTLSLTGTVTNSGNIAVGSVVTGANITSGTYITTINSAVFTATDNNTLVMNVTNVSSGTITVGMVLSATSFSNTAGLILSNYYTTSTATSTLVSPSGTLTGTVTAGEVLSGTGISANTTYITATVTSTGTISIASGSSATVTGSISGTTLTITANSGTIQPGMVIVNGTGLTTGTFIVANLTGTPTSASSTWTVSVSGAVTGITTITPYVATLTSPTGLFYPGMSLTGGTATAGTFITAQATATTSAVGSQAFSSGGAPAATTVTLAAGTNFAIGQLIAGTGLFANTYITNVVGAVITVSQPFHTQAAGTYNSYAASGAGTYYVTPSQTSTTATGGTAYTVTAGAGNVAQTTISGSSEPTSGVYITSFGSGSGGTGTYNISAAFTNTAGTANITGASYTVNQSQTAASASVSGTTTTVSYLNATTGALSANGTVSSYIYTYIVSGSGSTWQTTTNIGVNYTVSSTTITGTDNLITLSSVSNVSIGNPITFTTPSAGTALGNLVSSTTYYVTNVNSSTKQITVSATQGGSSFTVGTVATGLMNFYCPGYTYGTSIISTGFVSKTYNVGTNNYSVVLSFLTTTAPTTNNWFYVSGNSNSLYNGYFQCTASSTTSITLTYPFDPGTYGTVYTTPTYITAEVTNASSNTLGVSKPFAYGTGASGATLRLGYPANSAGQITVKISTTRATGHDFLNIGTGGYNTSNYPTQIYGNPAIAEQASNQILEETTGRVFYVTTDENGIFRVGRFFSVDQGTGTVTFSASIALSNLDGLGFKKGVVVAEFSTDGTMSENASDVVPVQSAIRTYIDSRLGLTHNGSLTPLVNLIGPGFLALDGSLSMKGNINAAGFTVSNLATPVYTTDAANKTYVDTKSNTYNAISKLTDATLASPVINNLLAYNGSKWVNASTSVGSNVTITYVGSNIVATINASVIVDSMVSSSASIAQSKLALIPAQAVATQGTAFTGAVGSAISTNNLGLSAYNSNVFNVTTGWVDLLTSSSSTTGIQLSKIVQIGAGTVLANTTGSAASPTAVTSSTIVTNGGGIINTSFASSGIMTVTYNGISTAGNVYGVTPVSVSNAASSIVQSASDKSVDVGSLKVATFTTLTVTGGNTLNFSTPGASSSTYFMTSTGSTVSNIITSTYGTFDTSNGTIKVKTITTGSSSTTASVTGNYQVQNGSTIDLYTYGGVLLSSTLSTGAYGNSGTITGNWSLSSQSQLQATYSDLAEWYTADEEYEPGTVLVFGGDAETTTTSTINDTRAAGIVTTNPAYTMNRELEGTRACIALAGRVPCKVVGRVKKGDMLTTSATPGYAVRATTPTLGAIIGKALEDKDYGEAGVIEVAVGRA